MTDTTKTTLDRHLPILPDGHFIKSLSQETISTWEQGFWSCEIFKYVGGLLFESGKAKGQSPREAVLRALDKLEEQ